MAEEHDLQPLLDTQQNQLNLTFSEGDSIDTKALAILGTDFALLLFIAEVSSLHFNSWWQQWLMFSPFLLSLVFDAFAAWPRHYIGASQEIDERPEYLAMDRETLLLQLLSDTELAIDKNSALNKKNGGTIR